MYQEKRCVSLTEKIKPPYICPYKAVLVCYYITISKIKRNSNRTWHYTNRNSSPKKKID